MKGRFVETLPPKLADNQMLLLAQTILKAKGVNVAKLVDAPRIPRSRW